MQRLLVEDGKQVRLRGRALDILIVLAERAGEVVTKAELMRLVWPGATVEEANLKFNISVLRQILRDGVVGRQYISTVRGRGYSFVVPVTVREHLPAAGQRPEAAEPDCNLPPLRRVLGRDQAIEDLTASLPSRRCLTIVGEGGVGKTNVAIAVAERLRSTYDDGVRFVDFAILDNPALAPYAAGFRLGLPMAVTDPVAQVADFLRGKRLLLVLDTCEHVVDTVAVLVGEVLKSAPAVDILATSREPLRTQGEHVVRLGGLAVPPAQAALSAEAAVRYAAVELFVERAAASRSGFRLTDEDAPFVAETCRRLDGVPLAMELAAAGVDAFGIRRLGELLSEGGLELDGGFRTAPLRQRTMGASHEWSYRWLAEPERAVLRRLSLLEGPFDLGAAIEVAGAGGASRQEVTTILAHLVAKSLVRADTTGPEPRFRLAESLRRFARSKLLAAGEAAEPMPPAG